MRSIPWLNPAACLAVAFLLGGCGDKSGTDRSDRPDTTAQVQPAGTAETEPPKVDPRFVFEPEPDTPEELADDLRTIYGWYPQHAKRIDFAMKNVGHVDFLNDFGFDSIVITPPMEGRGGFPVGHSIRLKLAAPKTAFVFRFVVDTLPLPRIRGEGIIGLYSVHCDDKFGLNLELPRNHSATARFDLLYEDNFLLAQLACCDIGPTIAIGRYGSIGDTLTLAITYDQSTKEQMFLLLGPDAARAYPRYGYCRFRTERGQFHPEMREPPYYCYCTDSAWVNISLANSWRGRRQVLEPVLRAKMF